MKPNLLLFLGLFLTVTIQNLAQQPSPTPILYSEKTVAQMQQLQQAALRSDYALKQTAYLSNNIGARLTGSLQAERAVQYVAEEMRKIGLDVRLQKLTVPHWVRGEERGEVPCQWALDVDDAARGMGHFHTRGMQGVAWELE